jgi:restriction system protein
MPIPDFQTLMQPVLSQLGTGRTTSPGELRDLLAQQFLLSEAELAQRLPSQRQTTFTNRVAWALAYLKRAGLIESPERGKYRLTERGQEVLARSPARIDIDFLNQFPEFVAFRTAPRREPSISSELRKVFTEGISPTIDGAAVLMTPDEQIRSGDQRLRESIAAQLLERVMESTPRFFEELVIDLLVAMGYGGSHEDAAKVVGGSGDSGIDGIIKEDRLGLESIYIQAKRWKDAHVVSRPDIQQFAGALQGHRARKGVFLTTSRFSDEARRYVDTLQTTIVLIDGVHLAQLMIEYSVGVSIAGTVKLLRLDEDYFSEE